MSPLYILNAFREFNAYEQIEIETIKKNLSLFDLCYTIQVFLYDIVIFCQTALNQWRKILKRIIQGLKVATFCKICNNF